MSLSQEKYISTVPLSITPPWLFPTVLIDFEMLEAIKNTGNIVVVVEDKLQTVYQAYVPVYTDGSKDPKSGRTGFAYSIPTLNYSANRRTSDHLSVYTVEMMAIVTALQWIEETQIKKVILCTDSCAALESLKSFMSHSRQDMVNEIYEILYRFKIKNIMIIFMWIPAHRGIKGKKGKKRWID